MISSRFAVAVHTLTLLASSEDEPLTSEMIAGSVNTNPVVVRRILGALKDARLVTIQSGVGGGARLARKPEQITLLDTYRAVEENKLFSMHNQQPNLQCMIGANIQESLEYVFDKAQEAMYKSLSEVTIWDMFTNAQERTNRAS